MTQKNLSEIIYVSWIESERGFGRRPDGCSLHLTKEDSKTFEQKYWARMPEETPDEYTRPSEQPRGVFVTQKLLQEVKEQPYGLRLWQSEERELIQEGELYKTIRGEIILKDSNADPTDV